MNKIYLIPEAEQLESFAGGNIASVYKLLGKYLDLNDFSKTGDRRCYLTISKEQLANYLKSIDSNLPERIVTVADTPKYHEGCYVERTGNGYLVYDMDHDRRCSERFFLDKYEAVATYLFWSNGLS